MKKKSTFLELKLLSLFVTFFLLNSFSSKAANVTIVVPTTFAAADASDGTTDGKFTVTGNLTIANGGSITCAAPANFVNACSIVILVSGNMEIQAGGAIYSNSTFGNSKAGNDSIVVGGTFIMRGPSGLIPGALIKSDAVSTVVAIGSAGFIKIYAGGDITMEPNSVISANSSKITAGTIEIIGGNNTDIDGKVLSQSGGSGAGCNPGHGGFITITAVRNLLISDEGYISSKSNDPGADLIHLCGCNVTIYGLVESTGSGHALPTCPVTHLVPPYRPDHLANSTAGVEVWAANELIINNTGGHNGQINADLTAGAANRSWIDLFCKGVITIIGSTDPLDPFAVHANNGGNANAGGIISIKSINDKIIMNGRAIQSNGGFGGSGGQITVEGKLNVDLKNAQMEAKGASRNGGKIDIRSYGAPGDILSNAGTTMNVSRGSAAFALGVVTLKECGVTPFSGTVTPAPNPTPTTGVCGGNPSLASYVAFCECGDTCRATITINKIVIGPIFPSADWQFSISGPGLNTTFTLPKNGGSITFTGIVVGTYTVMETLQDIPTTNPPIRYVAKNTCSSGVDTVGHITITDCEDAECTFTNTDPAVCQWCSKGAVLSQVRQNMGDDCAAPDIVVDIRQGHSLYDTTKVATPEPAFGSLQDALDWMNYHDLYDGNNNGDFNGDGKLFIGVIATDCDTISTICGSMAHPPAGDNPHGTENVIITNTHSGRLNVFGCSVTMWAADVTKPVITIKNSIGKVTVLDIHVKYSQMAGYLVENNSDLVVVKNGRAMFNDIGYWVTGDDVQITGSPQISNNRIGIQVDGDNNILRTNSDIRDNTVGVLINGDWNESNGSELGVSGHPNGTGMIVAGNNNVCHDDAAEYNTGSGIEVSGSFNELDGEDVNNNGGNGILVSGNNNTISDCNQIKDNGMNGIKVTGTGNLLDGNKCEENGGNGIKADQADGASGNMLKKNDTKDNGQQGIRACGQTDLGDNKGEDNAVDPQVVFSCPSLANAKFIVVDISGDKTYKYDATFNLITSTPLTSNNSDGNDVNVNGTNSYVLDKGDKQVYRYVGGNSVSKVLKDNTGNSLGTPSGLAISGNDMWVADGNKKKLYRYSLSAAFSGSGNINALQVISFSGNNGDAEGLAIDATYLYVLDNSDKQFYRYPRAGGAGVASKVMKDNGGSGLGNPIGAVLDGTSMWIVDDNKKKAYQYSFASLFSGAGNLNSMSSYALYISNDKPTGIAAGSSANLMKTSGSNGIIPSTIEEITKGFSVYPNPAIDEVTVVFSTDFPTPYTLHLTDIMGRIISTEEGNAVSGNNTHSMNLDRITVGIYFVELKIGNSISKAKLVIQE